jgi:hypothetical protein
VNPEKTLSPSVIKSGAFHMKKNNKTKQNKTKFVSRATNKAPFVEMSVELNQ